MNRIEILVGSDWIMNSARSRLPRGCAGGGSDFGVSCSLCLSGLSLPTRIRLDDRP